MWKARSGDVRKWTWVILGVALPLVAIPASAVAADEVILTDLIVDGSTCIGFDCVNGESFGFDTLRLKENNLRIRFYDTSSTASFPSNDWQLTANETTNGGKEKFSIDDLDSGRTPFTIEANAPNHSLYVNRYGRVGLGTNNPSYELHVKDGDSPGLRLQQDGSSGWVAQTWDVVGNETNFFVRDATYGSKLVFRIAPDSDSNSLTIRDGKVGLGTWAPATQLHVHKAHESGVAESLARFSVSDDSTAMLEIKNYSSGDGIFRPYIEATGQGNHIALTTQASIGNDGGTHPAMIFDCRIAGSGGGPTGQLSTRPLAEFRNNQSTRWTLDNAGNVTATSFVPTSSRELKKDIADLDADKAAAALDELNPVEFVFKGDPDEPHVGFIAEDVPELVATNDRRGVSSMDVVAVVTKVVKEQQRTIDRQNAMIAELAEEIQALKREMASQR